jgi:UDP-N-acetylmuramate dehydrogenase
MTLNQSLLKKQFPEVDFSFDYPLSRISYFKLGGSAEVFFKVKEIDLLKKIIAFCDEQNIPWSVVGGLSNVIVADKGVDGLILQIAFNNFHLLEDKEDQLIFSAEAGIKTSQLVGQAVKHSGTGLEGFIGVPGTLGGAIFNNAHYLNFFIGDYIHQVTAFHVKRNEDITFSHEKCQFAYEQSVFQNNKNLIILSAIFKLEKASTEIIKKRTIEAQQKRLKTQPLNYPSSGCIFRNPLNTDFLKNLFPQFAHLKYIPAGFLIDQAGLKNSREGAIEVSEQHAAFLINKAEEYNVDASTADLKKLIEKIRSTVNKKYQVKLEEEVFYLD